MGHLYHGYVSHNQMVYNWWLTSIKKSNSNQPGSWPSCKEPHDSRVVKLSYDDKNTVIRAIFQGISPKVWPYMVLTYLHFRILEISHWSHVCWLWMSSMQKCPGFQHLLIIGRHCKLTKPQDGHWQSPVWKPCVVINDPACWRIIMIVYGRYRLVMLKFLL